MNQSRGTIYILWFVVGGVGLFVLANNLISSGAFPSLPEYMAKVSQSTSTDNLASLTSSSTSDVSSSTLGASISTSTGATQNMITASSSETEKLLYRLSNFSDSLDASSTEATSSDFSVAVSDSELKQIKIAAPKGVLTAYVADTPALQELGLGKRVSLDSNKAMIFIFKDPARYAFWMKDMLFSIDMIWIDANKKVVDVSANISPLTYPQAFMPTSPVIYVLEVNAGVAQKMQIQKGTTLVFSLPQ